MAVVRHGDGTAGVAMAGLRAVGWSVGVDQGVG